jgi:hypothetical protein
VALLNSFWSIPTTVWIDIGDDEMSTELKQIYSLIPRVMHEIGAVGKDRKNEQQGYKFRGIEDFYNAAHPALVKHGVFCCPQVIDCDSQDRVSGTGKPSIRVTMKVSHKFYAPDGSFVDVITCGEGIDSSDKATNKAMSAAMKYALIELFSVPTQDVEDSDRDTPDVGARPLNVARSTEDIPIQPKNGNGDVREMPDAELLITPEQAKKLHVRFRDSLPEDLKPKADALLHDWLGLKLYVDAHGNPSALAIRKEEFATIGKAAVEHAKGLAA